MNNDDSEHTRKLLQMLADRAGIPELNKMLHEKEKSISLLEEQIIFCKIAVDVFQKELEVRNPK